MIEIPKVYMMHTWYHTEYNSVHLLCFISNAVKNRPVDEFQNFEGVA